MKRRRRRREAYHDGGLAHGVAVLQQSFRQLSLGHNLFRDGKKTQEHVSRLSRLSAFHTKKKTDDRRQTAKSQSHRCEEQTNTWSEALPQKKAEQFYWIRPGVLVLL